MKLRLPFVSLGLVAAAAALPLLPGIAPWLELDRQAFASGQVWRLWTGHLVHYGPGHLAWDAVAVLAFGGLLETNGRRGLRRRTIAWTVAAGAGAIGAGFLLFVDALTTYRGLSGIASLLFVWWAAESLEEARGAGDRVRAIASGLALLAFVAKSLFEVGSGDAVFVPASTEGFTPVPLAHAIGAIAGLLAVLIPDREASAHPRSPGLPPP